MSSLIEKLIQLSDSGKLPTAMAFVGPSGSGKSETAEAFAKKLMERGVCEPLYWLKPAGEKTKTEWIKVEQIHETLRRLSLRSLSKVRLVAIEPAEKLNPQSSNALLKALEEPPENTHFILITSSLASLLPTIRSRVQVFRFFSEDKEWENEDFIKLFDVAESGLLSLSQKDLDGWMDFLPTVKERGAALHLAKIFQFFFRDLIQESRMLPFTERLGENFNLEAFQITQAWKKAFEMEMAVNSNADRSLIFQNYFYEFQDLKG